MNYHIEFTFAGRIVRNDYPTLASAISHAEYSMAQWHAIRRVNILGDRHRGFPLIATIISQHKPPGE